MPARRAKTGRARSNGKSDHCETLRDLIHDSDVLQALIEHSEGRRELTSSQVSAGLNLLKKVLPDLATVQLDGGTRHTIVHRIERRIVHVRPDDAAQTGD